MPSKASNNAKNLLNMMQNRNSKANRSHTREPGNQNLRSIAYQRLLSRIANQASTAQLIPRAKSNDGRIIPRNTYSNVATA